MAQGIVYQAYMNNVSCTTTAHTLVQLKPVGVSGQLLRAWVSQSSSTTSTMLQVEIARMGTVASATPATVTSFTPIEYNPVGPVSLFTGSTTGTGTNGGSTGTVSERLYVDVFNILNGWLWVPTPEERIVVNAGQVIALRLPTALGSALTITAGIAWEEWQ